MTANPSRLLLAAALLAGAAAAPAQAATIRHVETTGTDNPSCSAAAPCRTLDSAIGIAQGGDTIKLGEGTFDDPGVVAKPLTFEGAGPATVIAGGLTLGADTTVRSLRATSAGHAYTLYVPSGYAPALHVEDVVVDGADTAVEIRGGSLTADRVTVVGTSSEAQGLNFDGSSAVLRQVTFDATSGLLRSVRHGNGNMRIEDSRLAGRYGASSVAGDLTIERSRIDATGVALSLNAGSAGATRAVAVSDSVLIGRGTSDAGTALSAQNLSDGATLGVDVRRSTLVARGGDSHALSLQNAGGTIEATLTGSIAAAETDIRAFGASVSAAGSAFRTAEAEPGGGVTAPGTAGNLAIDPGLAADGSLPAGSPLVDAADVTLLPSDARDAAGAPRLTDGDGDGEARMDVGGLERPVPPAPQLPQAPPDPAGPQTPPAATAPDALAPVVRGLKIRRGTRRVARFTLSEAAEVRVTLRRVGGRTVRRVVRRKAAGVARIKFRRADLARPGRYAVRVVAVDAASNRSAPVKRTFRVHPR
ncbi:MAG TPA: hypothetical protein VD836_13565 [Solirubrobacteraceae bacterium]|nr:hypothetical protein [Solirubrobacteraceae bacterium]